jgi:hypothetical protein
VLRHDVAGLMQPVRLLSTVLERRLLKPDLDREALINNATSLNALLKEASAGCMNAIGWMAVPSEDLENSQVNLQRTVDDLSKLLALEFLARSITLVNGIMDETRAVPQSFMRTVFMGLLFEFCDSRAGSGRLDISLLEGKLLLRFVGDPEDQSPLNESVMNPSRPIHWQDVDAIAESFGWVLSRGEGWAAIDLQQIKRKS